MGIHITELVYFHLTRIQENGRLEGAKINNSIFLLLLKGRQIQVLSLLVEAFPSKKNSGDKTWKKGTLNYIEK